MNRTELKQRLLDAKQDGFSDAHLAKLWGVSEVQVRDLRKDLGILTSYKTVDTCAAEFEAYTPYHYSSYETPFKRLTDSGEEEIRESEVRPSNKQKVMILGGGPNRIGQGIEFDYCCCQAVYALQQEGYETIMVNSNPETVSTDYDTADRLYFEPLTFEDVMNIIEAENPIGVILQFGGQTPLNLAIPLEKAGVRILGTSPDSIDLTEDRGRFGKILEDLRIPMPQGGTAYSFEGAKEVAARINYPVLVRPSYVLGGRAMMIVHDEARLEQYMKSAVDVNPDRPVLVDRFLANAVEVDVDAICDGKDVFIGGIMEHIEYAGIHSGDSACVIPPRSLSPKTLEVIKDYTHKMALALKVKGLMNVQYAVHGIKPERDGADTRQGEVYVLEVNPRASRTVPYVSKAVGIPLAKIAANVMLGKSLKELGLGDSIAEIKHFAVKEAALPFAKFPNVDPILGPEMRSTGEVIGVAKNFGLAFAKAQEAVNSPLPKPPEKGAVRKIFCSVNDRHKEDLLAIGHSLHEMGFTLVATSGTKKFLEDHGIPAKFVYKIHEGRPSICDLMINQEICLVINTPNDALERKDDLYLRRAAVEYAIPYVTTMSAARATVEGIRSYLAEDEEILSLQEYHKNLGR